MPMVSNATIKRTNNKCTVNVSVKAISVINWLLKWALSLYNQFLNIAGSLYNHLLHCHYLKWCENRNISWRSMYCFAPGQKEQSFPLKAISLFRIFCVKIVISLHVNWLSEFNKIVSFTTRTSLRWNESTILKQKVHNWRSVADNLNRNFVGNVVTVFVFVENWHYINITLTFGNLLTNWNTACNCKVNYNLWRNGSQLYNYTL